MFNTRAKQERKLGTPLFLKPFRSLTGKSAITRRPTRPGQHGAARRRMGSEYARQLIEKQKVRFTYGVRETQMKNYFRKASKSTENTGSALIGLLERRLDNVVFRLGIVPSRSMARQLVSHGHIHVNGRRLSAPSAQMRVGDVITIRPQSASHPVLKDMAERLEKGEVPSWLAMNAETREGTLKALPTEIDTSFDIFLVVDYYSKLVK